MTEKKQEENLLNHLVAPLLWWYDENRRILPWREEPTPYRVWVSEIMLQQTRVEAGRGYFERFVRELPDIEALANVDDQRLMKLWEGLGYYNRASNLKKAAGIIMEKYAGKMPDTLEGLLELPGIGSYTAGAVGSIAYGLPVAAVDGNVLRVLARIQGDYRDILSAAVKKDREKQLAAVMPLKRPGDFNQALMELGAVVCLPNGEPRCSQCPVIHLCNACAEGTISDLPVKRAKKERKLEEKTMLVLVCNGRLALQRRPEKGLLRGLWELPWLQGFASEEEVQLLGERACREVQRKAAQTPGSGRAAESIQVNVTPLDEAKHIFSHVEWRMMGYRVDVSGSYAEKLFQTMSGEKLAQGMKPLVGERPLHWVSRDELEHQVALPTAYKQYRKAFMNEG